MYVYIYSCDPVPTVVLDQPVSQTN
jgi:hypothetical protein